MRNYYTYLLFACGLLIIGCKNKERAIMGKWQKVNQEKSIDEDFISIIPGNNNSSRIQTELIFNADNTVDVKQGNNEYSADFVLQPDLLTLGNREYELIKLDSDSLVLKAKSDFSFGIDVDRYYRIK